MTPAADQAKWLTIDCCPGRIVHWARHTFRSQSSDGRARFPQLAVASCGNPAAGDLARAWPSAEPTPHQVSLLSCNGPQARLRLVYPPDTLPTMLPNSPISMNSRRESNTLPFPDVIGVEIRVGVHAKSGGERGKSCAAHTNTWQLARMRCILTGDSVKPNCSDCSRRQSWCGPGGAGVWTCERSYSRLHGSGV